MLVEFTRFGFQSMGERGSSSCCCSGCYPCHIVRELLLIGALRATWRRAVIEWA